MTPLVRGVHGTLATAAKACLLNRPTANSALVLTGCLVTMANETQHVWVVHADGTRSWLSSLPAGNATTTCKAKALVIPNVSIYPERKRALTSQESAKTCSTNPRCTHAPPRAPPPPPPPPIRFIALNGDYTSNDVAWKDLAVPFEDESWDEANVPTIQIEWLAQQLDAAALAGQRVIVFIHYRLDGGPGGPVCSGLGANLSGCPAVNPDGKWPNRGWVDDCTLQNAAVVRAVLETHPGLVLATFSGHDHVPLPPWTKAALEKPCYFTHAGLVEGPVATSNAYSIVHVLKKDCSIVVEGFGNATSVVIPGPPNCSLER